MAKLFRISDAASLGLHAMSVLAAEEGQKMTVHLLATELEVSENHLAKVMQRLVKTGLVDAERGPGGGVRLARDPSQINFMQIYEAVEGPADENHCLLGRSDCIKDGCILGGLVAEISERVREQFINTTLDRFTTSRSEPAKIKA